MTRLFLLNLFLAIVYVGLTGDDFTLLNFFTGFFLGYLVLAMFARATGQASYPGKVFRLLGFLWYFMVKLVRSNIEVAWEVVTPNFYMQPRIVRYPVHDMTHGQIATFANVISLTPGTLTADVDDQGRFLYIHCMYGGDRDAVIKDLDDLKNRMLKDVFN